MQRRSTRAALRALSVMGIVGTTIIGFAVAVPAQANAATPSVLAKSAQDVTHPGASPASHGDTLNWVLSYADNAGASPAPATITDPIGGAGNTQTYVPGSLRVPPGWTTSYSTDGSTFGTSDPGTATVAVRATNSTARQGGTNLGNLLLAPVQPTATSTGGDGYTPIIYRADNGDVEAWNIYHHLNAGAPKVVCSDLATATKCAGGSWPAPLNTTPGPLGAEGPDNVGSTLTPQYVQDPNRPGVVYYAAITPASVGVGCLDMGARANCGYVPLESIANGTLSGFVAQGGDIYGVGADGRVLCMTIASQAPCASEPYAAVVPGNRVGAAGNFEGSLAVAGGKVFMSSSSTQPALGCFDPATTSACAGWPSAKPVGPAGVGTFSAYPDYNQAGTDIGACSTTSGAVVSTCYAIDGSSVAAPTVFSAVNGQSVFSTETARAPGGDLKSYTGAWSAANNGFTVCYDWTTAAACAGFPLPDAHPTVNGGATRDYGYSYDPTTRCLFGLGDAGVLFSLDPTTGSTPCIHSGASVTLSPSTFYCDGGANHVHGYTNATLEGINLADVDLSSSTVDVTDPGGAEIASPAFAADGSIDLSGISVVQHPSITVSVHLVLLNSNDFTGGNQPHVVVSFAGDAPQVCLQTTVAPTCTASAVTDTANGADATGTFTSNPVTVPVAPGAGCQPNVTVNKEICASNDDQDCGPGGAGPWVKQAPVGLLGLLFAHPRWRITVTDNGPVGITGARVNDAVEPTCGSAAGTFDLAAGASRQVFCSTSILVSLLPLTNTTSVTFVPVNSPSGTKPSTTASSSAIACSLLCALRN